jgi:hypothetical protein
LRSPPGWPDSWIHWIHVACKARAALPGARRGGQRDPPLAGSCRPPFLTPPPLATPQVSHLFAPRCSRACSALTIVCRRR